MKRALALLLAAATPLVPATAAASGFLVARFGGDYAGPATSHPSAIYYNPAGLALGHGTRIALEGVFALRSIEYTRPDAAVDNPLAAGVSSGGTPSDATGANSGTATLSNFVAAPFAGFASDLGVKHLGVGAGVYVPFGGSASWDENSAYAGNTAYPGAVDGVQRWHAIDGTIRSLYASAGAAYYLPGPRLSVGAAVNFVRNQIDTLRARNADGTDDLVSAAGTLQEGRSLVTAAGNTLSVGAGVIWLPTDRLFVGLSYQSQPGFGENTLDGFVKNKLSGGTVTSGDIEVLQELPDVMRAGFRFLASDRLELRAQAEFVRWSLFEKQCFLDKTMADRACRLADDGSVAVDDPATPANEAGVGIIVNVPRAWQDALGARIGATYLARPGLEVSGSLGWDGNAVPDETIDPALFDMNKVFAGVGARIGLLGERLSLTVNYTQFIYFTREVAPRMRDAAGDAVTGLPPSRQPDAAGTYAQSIGALSVGLDWAF
ncbi:MAG: hypothetical protein EXR73_01915 [Myxococcales bacterium]|nr:hypothetical protein [Myxococcales bacterium]